MTDSPFARLPSVDSVLSEAPVQALLERLPRPLVVAAVRSLLDDLRSRLRRDPSASVHLDASAIEERCGRLRRGTLRKVLNATGVVVHTNLGRAPLPRPALDRLVAIASGYSNLEYDLERGARGSRHDHAAGRLRTILGAEDAVVVNNNAAAVLLSLAAIASGREVVVSRGELVEIGGSFRIPDVMAQSGAKLVEVGTTNKTRLADYERAISDETALLLKVHRSNFEIVGFTEEVDVGELSALGKRRGLPVMVDLGSGCLEEGFTSFPGHFPELGVRATLRAGADLVTFSGDKLLGGPQAGIVAGRRELVERIRHHPLMRAVRPCKLTLSALDAVLDLYQWGQFHEIPVVRMICESPESVRMRLTRLLERLGEGDENLAWEEVALESRVGGGAQPLLRIPSVGLALRSSHFSAKEIERRLRASDPPVVARISDDAVLLDLRTIAEDEIETLAAVLARLRETAVRRRP